MSTAVILAGGLSTRMGFDKQFLKLDDDLLMQKSAHLLCELFDHVFVISNNDVLNIDDFPSNVSIFKDEIDGCGPLGGIHMALTQSQDAFVYVMACDMPNINLDFIERLYLDCTPAVDAVVTRFGEWIEPFHAMYNKSLTKDIEKYLAKGRRSIYGLLKNRSVAYIKEEETRTFSPDWALFDNINTKEDLLRQIVI